MVDSQAAAQAQVLAEQIGELFYSWGFKRIHGKMWTHLMLSEQALDASSFVSTLNISKALVSISLRELLHYRAIHLAGKSLRGTQLYRIETNLKAVLHNVLKERERAQVRQIQSTCQNLLTLSSESLTNAGLSKNHIAQLGDWLQNGSSLLDNFIIQLNQFNWQHRGTAIDPNPNPNPNAITKSIQDPNVNDNIKNCETEGSV